MKGDLLHMPLHGRGGECLASFVSQSEYTKFELEACGGSSLACFYQSLDPQSLSCKHEAARDSYNWKDWTRGVYLTEVGS